MSSLIPRASSTRLPRPVIPDSDSLSSHFAWIETGMWLKKLKVQGFGKRHTILVVLHMAGLCSPQQVEGLIQPSGKFCFLDKLASGHLEEV